MKLSNKQRLQLENNGLKQRLIQIEMAKLKEEFDKLQREHREIFEQVSKENNLDVDKINIDIQTGEVRLIEDKKEA